MSPFDRTVYFIGAGATRADFPDAPLGEGLLHKVLASDTSPKSLSAFLARIYEPASITPNAPEHDRPRLDDVLTLLETAINKRAPLPSDLSYEEVVECHRLLLAGIGKTLESALGTVSGSRAGRLADHLLESSATIITTNYDIVFDNVLFDRHNVNYGVPVRSAVWRVNGHPADREDEARHYVYDVSHSLRILSGRLPLLKLNGSLNWLYCPRCDELDVSFHEKAGVAILTEPHLGRCAHGGCTARYQALLVGPSLEQRYDNRILAEVWSRAERAVAQAERIVLIGYSLPGADYLIRAMLTRHFAKRGHAVFVFTSRSPEGRSADEDFTLRYQRLFPNCTIDWGAFDAHIESLVRQK